MTQELEVGIIRNPDLLSDVEKILDGDTLQARSSRTICKEVADRVDGSALIRNLIEFS